MAQKRDDLRKKWAQIVARAWSDEKFKEKLLKNPEQVLKEQGFELPQGHKFQIHEQKSKVHHLVLPEKPVGEMSEEELRKVAGATSCAEQECVMIP